MWQRRNRAAGPSRASSFTGPPEPAAPVPAPDHGDGRDAITYFAGWIGNADTKSGLLATGLTVLGVTSAQRAHDILHATPAGWRGVVAASCVLLSLLGIAVSAVYLTLALAPRTSPPPAFSRYAFPAIAQREPGFVPDLDGTQQRAEAWIQAHALATVALTKYRCFRRGLYTFAAGAVFFGVGVLLG